MASRVRKLPDNVDGPLWEHAGSITKDLACSTNSPGVGVTNDHQPNTVGGARSGQCGAAGF